MIKTGKKIIALAGNPNCGKTTIFNSLTGSDQKVGNWPGVTVERKEGSLKANGSECIVVDLPGIYSLSADSEDEKAARDYLLSGEVDLVINIIDSTNIERNLFMTTQIMEMGIPTIIALNMTDLAEKKGIQIDPSVIQKETGCPVLRLSAVNSIDCAMLKSNIMEYLQQKNTGSGINKVVYPQAIEKQIEDWKERLAGFSARIGADARWTALKLLEGDPWVIEGVTKASVMTESEIENGISAASGSEDHTDTVIASSRYRYITAITSKAVKRPTAKAQSNSKLDNIVLHRVFGIPIFLGVMYLTFWLTMFIGGAFIDFFDILFGTIFVDGFGLLLSNIGAPEALVNILAGGIGGGIQTIGTFVPIVFMMFLMLAILEDSGYMSRAAFVMDRFMRSIGLPGKAFVPMLVGFGCTVPAIMATRTLDSRKDRFMTIFMAPFMSCGARLPVYALFGAAFFGTRSGLIVFSIYLAGIVLAILTGLLLKKTLFKGESSPFVMELPAYHFPKARNIFKSSGTRLKYFVIRAGKVITIAVLVISFLNSLGTDGSFGNEDSDESVLSAIGQAITPVFEPMGIQEDNWPATVGLFTGLFAKEVVVGTLNSLYLAEAVAEGETLLEDESEFDLLGGIGEAFASIGEALAGSLDGFKDPFGVGIIGEASDEEVIAEEVEADIAVFERMRTHFTPAAAYAYLLFILIYFPCVAALGAAFQEMGRAYGTILVSYLTVLAWITSTLFYQIAEGHQAVWIIVPLVLLAGIFAVFRRLAKKPAAVSAK